MHAINLVHISPRKITPQECHVTQTNARYDSGVSEYLHDGTETTVEDDVDAVRFVTLAEKRLARLYVNPIQREIDLLKGV